MGADERGRADALVLILAVSLRDSMTKINPQGGADAGAGGTHKKGARIAVLIVAAFALLVLADSLLELGIVDSILSESVGVQVSDIPAAQEAAQSESALKPLAARPKKLKAKKEPAPDATPAPEPLSKENALGTPNAAAMPLQDAQNQDRVADALANIATWQPVKGAYPEDVLFGYLQHRKSWVSMSALAFAIETGAYSKDFLEARASEIAARSQAGQLGRFAKRYRTTKPAVYAELQGLLKKSAR